jgi:hypothetical protein
MRRLSCAVLALVGLIAATFGLASAQEAEPFAIEGHIRNGTAGADAPSDVRIQAYAYTSDRIDGPWEAQTDASGGYRIEGVAGAEGAVYVLGVDYLGASYAERVDQPPANHVASKDLTVYETSPTDPGVRFEQVALLVGNVDAGQGTINVVEIHRLENPTDRTFAPSPSGPGGPAGLLVFPLPPDAFDLRPEAGLDPARVIQIDRGFASMAPVPPGRTEIAFSYRFPYAESSFDLTRTVRYPISRLNVLVPQDGPTVASSGLAPSDTATIGGKTYRTLSGGPFPTGQPLLLTFSGLPLPGGPFGRIPPATVAIVGALVGLAVLVKTALSRSRPTEIASAEQNAVLDQLVVLEREHAEARLPEDAYERQHAALVAQLRTVPAPEA